MANKDLLPKGHLPDWGFVNTNVMIESQKQHGVEVIGPIKVDTTWQAQSDIGFDVSYDEPASTSGNPFFDVCGSGSGMNINSPTVSLNAKLSGRQGSFRLPPPGS